VKVYYYINTCFAASVPKPVLMTVFGNICLTFLDKLEQIGNIPFC